LTIAITNIFKDKAQMQKPGFFSWSILVGLVMASLVLHFIPKPQATMTPVTSYAPAVNKAAPAVVNIYTSKVVREKTHPLLNEPFFKRFFKTPPETKDRIQNSLGSGVIVDPNGFIVTNNHVINGADEILVALHDGRTANASVIGTDIETDLALLKIELGQIPSIAFSDKELQIGDIALAIGNPYEVGQTVTLGIVSATGRNQLGITTYEDFIQTDAAINPGNSGGALVNAYGELVGINTAIYTKSAGNQREGFTVSQGIGFAIPLNHVLKIVSDLAKYGQVVRGWLGLETRELSDQLKQAFSLPDSIKGQVVVGVSSNGPADKAGLMEGDIVTHFNGEQAAKGTRTMRQIADLLPGDKITLGIYRQGQYLELVAVLGRRINQK
jgi:serine protease DegS